MLFFCFVNYLSFYFIEHYLIALITLHVLAKEIFLTALSNSNLLHGIYRIKAFQVEHQALYLWVSISLPALQDYTCMKYKISTEMY